MGASCQSTTKHQTNIQKPNPLANNMPQDPNDPNSNQLPNQININNPNNNQNNINNGNSNQKTSTAKNLQIINPNLEQQLLDEENYKSKYSNSLNTTQNPNCIFLKEKIIELIRSQPNYNISLDEVRYYEEQSKITNYKTIPAFVMTILKKDSKYFLFIMDAINQAFSEMKTTFQKSDIAILLTNFYLLIPANQDDIIYKKEKLTLIIYFLEKYSLEKLEEDYQLNVKNLKKTITSISYIVIDFMINVIFQIVVIENPTKYNVEKLKNLTSSDKSNRKKVTELVLEVLINANVIVGFSKSSDAFNCILESLVIFLCKPLKDTSKY